MKNIKVWVVLLFVLTLVGTSLIFSPTTIESQNKGLYFRNNTNRPIWVAIRYHREGGGHNPPAGSSKLAVMPSPPDWVTTGWTTIRPGQSTQAISHLSNRYYYFYAINDQGTWWGDKGRMRWVTNKSFNVTDTQLNNVSNLQGNGWYTAPFREVDTSSYSGYTYNLYP